MKRYPEYKESGLDLVGGIPVHWCSKRGDGVFDYHRDTVTAAVLSGLEVLHFSIPSVQECGEGKVEDGASIASGKLRLRGGELLISKLNPRKGTVTLVDADHPFMVCSSEFVPLVAVGCDHRFAYYLYSSEITRQRLSAVVESSTRSHQRADPADIYKLWNAFPPLEEQRLIADYLDRKTAQIDTLIRKKQALIDLLREQRTALINRAVTKGLDPDVPMKDSGIEWLGEVPAHWKRSKVKFELQSLNHRRIPLNSEVRGQMTERRFDYYGASGVIDMVEDYIFDEDLVLIAEDGANLLSRSSPLAFIARGKYWVNNHAHILKPWTGNIDFFASLLEVVDYTPFVTGAAQPKLTSEALSNIELPVPPRIEQDLIAAFIERKTLEVATVIQREESLIQGLRELRASLISEVVTGKIDVRDSAAASPDADLAA